MAHSLTTSRDPVCGMSVPLAESQYSATYRGMAFHFCSAQCLGRFQEEPALYASPTHLLNTQPIPKRRWLRILPADPETVEIACQRIGEMMGVTSVEAKADGVLVEYDLRQATLDQVEAVAQGEGLRLRGGLRGLQRSWWKFVEGNEVANAAHPESGACCSRPPTRVR